MHAALEIMNRIRSTQEGAANASSDVGPFEQTTDLSVLPGPRWFEEDAINGDEADWIPDQLFLVQIGAFHLPSPFALSIDSQVTYEITSDRLRNRDFNGQFSALGSDLLGR